MTGYEYNENNSIEILEAEALQACESAKRAAREAARRAAAKAEKKADDMLILVGAAAIGLVVFFILGFALAKQRGFNGGIGSEVIFCGAIVYGIFRLWKKIKPYLN